MLALLDHSSHPVAQYGNGAGFSQDEARTIAPFAVMAFEESHITGDRCCATNRTEGCAELIVDNLDDWAAWHQEND